MKIIMGVVEGCGMSLIVNWRVHSVIRGCSLRLLAL